MSDLVYFAPVRAWDRNGVYAPGALAYFYEPGTTTPRVVYTDAALTVAHGAAGDAVVANARGVFPPVYTSGAVDYKVTDADGVTLVAQTQAVLSSASGAAAGQTSFEPTGNIPQDNVQEAIEQVDDNWRAGLEGFGLGVTTTAPLLSNLDAGNIPSGVPYRFDMTTTTGTAPDEWTGTAAGNVIFFREFSGSGMMFAMSRDDGKLWFRQYVSSTWQAWERLSRYTYGTSGWNAGVGTNYATITPALFESTLRYRRQRFVAEDRKTSGTDGGASASASWQTRTLNTTVLNEITGASRAGNVITLPAGEYYVDARAPGHAVNGHQAQLYNNDTSAAIINGSSEYAGTGTGVGCQSHVAGRFTLTAETDVILRHYTQAATATVGLGRATGSGAGEVYARVEITRLGDYIA